MYETPEPSPAPAPGIIAGNLGKPLTLTDLQLNGITAEHVRGGSTVKIWTRLWLTSDDKGFHKIAEGLAGHIQHRCNEAGHRADLRRGNFVLLVIHPDNTGDLWVDTAAVLLNVMIKRPLAAGAPVFENDIADVTGMSFPLVEIAKEDRIVCLFRQGWRFAFFCDFNPDNDLSIQGMEKVLGTLHRRLKYRDLYDAVADQNIFGRLVDAGWFPFAEIIGSEFRQLADCCEAGFDLEDDEKKIVTAFDSARAEKMFARWMAKPHFAGKERLLRSALNNFIAQDSVAVLKIVLTEIEGILAEAYRRTHGKGAKIKKLLEFAVESAEQKVGQSDTLLFPAAFAHYLQSHTFADFDPAAQTGKANSRHAVGHGAADADSYTQVRALQALLTLDQLAFYT